MVPKMIVVAGPPGSGVGPPKLLMETEKSVIRFLVEDPPKWLANVLDLA